MHRTIAVLAVLIGVAMPVAQASAKTQQPSCYAWKTTVTKQPTPLKPGDTSTTVNGWLTTSQKALTYYPTAGVCNTSHMVKPHSRLIQRTKVRYSEPYDGTNGVRRVTVTITAITPCTPHRIAGEEICP